MQVGVGVWLLTMEVNKPVGKFGGWADLWRDSSVVTDSRMEHIFCAGAGVGNGDVCVCVCVCLGVYVKKQIASVFACYAACDRGQAHQ